MNEADFHQEHMKTPILTEDLLPEVFTTNAMLSLSLSSSLSSPVTTQLPERTTTQIQINGRACTQISAGSKELIPLSC
jgi:hypothetical protein